MGRRAAMNVLAGGLHKAEHNEDALSVQEADLAMRRRLGDSTSNILVVQGNLATTYQFLGRSGQAHSMRRDVYFGCLKLRGEEHEETFREAVCYSSSFLDSSRPEEAKSVLRKTTPLARRVLGQDHIYTLQLTLNYAKALYKADGARLEDLREAVGTLEETRRTARRVMGDAHPTTTAVEGRLRIAQAVLRAREE